MVIENDMNKNEYLQPECQLVDIDLEQFIAVSGESGTQNYDEEDYKW